jgi:signal transduction histidine kinase
MEGVSRTADSLRRGHGYAVAMEMRAPGWAWTGRLKPRTLDWLIVGVLLVLGLLSVAAAPFTEPRTRALTTPWMFGLALVLLLLQTIPLAWRRTHPSIVLVLVASAFGLKVLFGINTSVAALGILVAMYSVAVYEPGRRRLVFLAIAALGFVAGFVAFGLTGNPRSLALSVPSLAHVAAWLLGDYLRTRRAYVAQLEERAARLERERDQDRQVAADQERARIARELHDVVAHDVSVIAIQAGAARTVQPSKPQAALQALGLIETTARQTLDELSQLLGVLRKRDGTTPDRNPQPGIDKLPALVDELQSAGLTVDVVTNGEARPLPPAVDLSAYRILQEATTNVLKHAQARHVAIRIAYRPHDIVLFIRDDGVGKRSAPSGGNGHGLIGMRERVSLFGGHLRAGAPPNGGFLVVARLPIKPAA